MEQLPPTSIENTIKNLKQRLIESDTVVAFQEVVINDIVKRFSEMQAETLLSNEVVIAAYIAKSYRKTYNPEFDSGEEVLRVVEAMVDRDETLDEDTKTSFKETIRSVYRVKQ